MIKQGLFDITMIKGAIFDADGTVLDSLHVWRRADEIYLHSLDPGLEFNDAVYKELCALTFYNSLIYVKEYYRLTLSADEIKRGIMNIVLKMYESEVRAFPEAVKLLKELKTRGIPAVIATSNDKALIGSALRSNGIYGCFKDIVTCDEHGTDKKSADIFIRAADLIGAPVCETAVFEDDETALESAEKAGFITVKASEIRRFRLE